MTRAFLAALLVGALAPAGASSQCALSVRPKPGDTGYRERDQRCEGMYVGLQSAPLNVQVISLVKGGLSYRLDSEIREIEVRVPAALANDAELEKRVLIVGRAREPNLNWALDGFASPGSPMNWKLDDVVRKEQLSSDRIGLFGETKRTDGMGGPVYIPLEVSRSAGAQAATIELIVRIPPAAAASWSVGTGADRKPAEPLNADGYFRIVLPATPAPEKTRVAVYWRPRGESRMSDVPEHLRIFRW